MMFQVFLFFNIDESQGHTMNLSDLLCVELYNDNLKMFDEAWEETLQALGNHMEENVLENFF